MIRLKGKFGAVEIRLVNSLTIVFTYHISCPSAVKLFSPMRGFFLDAGISFRLDMDFVGARQPNTAKFSQRFYSLGSFFNAGKL